jgi:hypothetical protein
MDSHNHEYLRLFAEDRVRAFLLEAERHSKLQQIRMHHQSWLS